MRERYEMAQTVAAIERRKNRCDKCQLASAGMAHWKLAGHNVHMARTEARAHESR